MSPSDQPLEFRLTLSREEAVTFLRELAHNSDLRGRFESNPREVLSEWGIEVTPAEAVPSTVTAPDPEAFEYAITQLQAQDVTEGWNAQFQWAHFPFIGLLGKPMEGGGPEAS